MNNIKKIRDYYNRKYCKVISDIILIKSLSYASLFVKNKGLYLRLNILNVAPMGNMKTVTTKELENVFPVKKGVIINTGSNTTIHGIHQKYPSGDLSGKVLILNDLTLLLNSTNKRTRSRLFGAIAELLSDKEYGYADNMTQFKLFGDMVVLGNLTYEDFVRHNRLIVKSTFGDRFLIVFFKLSNIDLDLLRKKKDLKTTPFKKIHLKKTTIKNLSKYNQKIFDYSLKWQYLTYSSKLRMLDKIDALLSSIAVLNNRDEIIDSDFEVLDSLEYLMYDLMFEYNREILDLVNRGETSILKIAKEVGCNRRFVTRFLSDTGKTKELRHKKISFNEQVIDLYNQGKSYKDICRILNKPESFVSSIFHIISDYKSEGDKNV